VLQGLLDREFDTTIFHRGTHEPDDLPEVRHIHGDPHFAESIKDCVGNRDFDLVLAAYGRTRFLAESFRGRTERFIAIGGPPRYKGFYNAQAVIPSGLPIPVREFDELVGEVAPADGPAVQFSRKLVETEVAVFDAHPTATYMIFPVMYGPRNVIPWEWSIIKRALDGRRVMLLPDDGLAVHSRGASKNMAHVLLLAIDRPEQSQGSVYNCADDVQYSLRQWTELILHEMGSEMSLVGVPAAVAPSFVPAYIPTPQSLCAHSILDTTRARLELGYSDAIAPVSAIAESIDWYRRHPVDAQSWPWPETFNYDVEDALIEAWSSTVASLATQIPQPVYADRHPMPHPKSPNQEADERAR
jgi:nucleoside-diphosphate-sugar epimerase